MARTRGRPIPAVGWQLRTSLSLASGFQGEARARKSPTCARTLRGLFHFNSSSSGFISWLELFANWCQFKVLPAFLRKNKMREKPSTSVCLSHVHMVHYAVSLDTGELDLLVFKTFKPLVSFQVKCKYLALQVIISRGNRLFIMKETSKDSLKSNTTNKIPKGDIYP